VSKNEKNIHDELKVYEGMAFIDEVLAEDIEPVEYQIELPLVMANRRRQGIITNINIKEKKMDKKKKPYVEVTIISPKKKKGTWINGENLDKMKFPSYIKYELNGKLRVGEIHRGKFDPQYFITDVKQSKFDVKLASNGILKTLMIMYKIKVLKAKLIIFDEGDN